MGGGQCHVTPLHHSSEFIIELFRDVSKGTGGKSRFPFSPIRIYAVDFSPSLSIDGVDGVLVDLCKFPFAPLRLKAINSLNWRRESTRLLRFFLWPLPLISRRRRRRRRLSFAWANATRRSLNFNTVHTELIRSFTVWISLEFLIEFTRFSSLFVCK